MARVVARGRVEGMDRVVDGHGGFAEAGGDELELAVVGGDVASGEDVGQVGAHEAVDFDGVAFEGEAPVGDGRARRGPVALWGAHQLR